MILSTENITLFACPSRGRRNGRSLLRFPRIPNYQNNSEIRGSGWNWRMRNEKIRPYAIFSFSFWSIKQGQTSEILKISKFGLGTRHLGPEPGVQYCVLYSTVPYCTVLEIPGIVALDSWNRRLTRDSQISPFFRKKNIFYRKKKM